MPKVDLHRHLEGSLRLRTLLEVGRAYGLDVPNTKRLQEMVQIGEDESYTFENFLSKFQVLRLFYRSPEIIARLTREAIADAAADNVRYLELRFTPAALGRVEGFPLDQVINWVATGAQEAAHEFNITARLIISVNRHEGLELATSVVQLATRYQTQGVVGLDLAGNEAHFSGLPFKNLFREARQAGLHITVHAGEWGGPQNVIDAITELGAERIGHGVRVLEDPSATALARETQTPFEVCVTSNYQSGVVPALSVHPLSRMLALGLNATINTDDPSISQIRLSHEYQLVCRDLHLQIAQLRACILASARAAFLPEVERQKLVQDLSTELAAFSGEI